MLFFVLRYSFKFRPKTCVPWAPLEAAREVALGFFSASSANVSKAKEYLLIEILVFFGSVVATVQPFWSLRQNTDSDVA